MYFGFLLKFVDCQNFDIDEYTQLENSILSCYEYFSNIKVCILEIESCLTNMKCKKENKSQSKSKNDYNENLAIKEHEKARKELKHLVYKFGRNAFKMAGKIIKYYELLKDQKEPNVEVMSEIFRSYNKSGKEKRTRFKTMSSDFIINLNIKMDNFLKKLHQNYKDQNESLNANNTNENLIQTKVEEFIKIIESLDKELVNLDSKLSPNNFKNK